MNVRLAIRQLRANPGFTVMAVGILGLGIGANTALFSVIYGVLLRPLPFQASDRIVVLSTLWANQPESIGDVSGPDFADWRDRSSAFEKMAAYAVEEGSAIAPDAAHYARIASVTSGFDKVMGVTPAIGRWFTPEEEAERGPPVAIVSHRFARQALAGDALGKRLTISGRACIVIGVTPPGFTFPEESEVWKPAGKAMEHESRTAHNWQVVARIKNAQSIEQARSQMNAIGSQLAAQYHDENREKRVAVTGLRDRLVRDVRRMLLMLFGAVALVLLIACANVANLLLAKASTRTKELAIRSALGATRGRIVAQLLTESLVLAALSGGAGILLGNVLLKASLALAPESLPRSAEIQIDSVVLLFTAAISVFSTLAFGLVPALKALRIDVNDALKQSGTRTTTAPKLPHALVMGEIAMATMLAVAAALTIRTFRALLAKGLGYQTTNVLLTEARFMFSPEREGALRNVRRHWEIAGEMRQIPGVLAVAGVLGAPASEFHSSGAYLTGTAADPNNAALFTVITPGYFSTMQIPLLDGRDFSDADNYRAPFVAIVNRALARQAFPDGNPIGRRIQCGLDSDAWMTVIGVVEDTRTLGPAAPELPELYMPAMQHPSFGQRMTLVTRTANNPAAVSDAIRRVIGRRAPDVPVKSAALATLLAENLGRPRFRAFMLASMAGLAVLLAMAGVYGVMAYGVGLRRAEFGVRMALGAEPRDLIRMVLAQGAGVAVGGLALGIAGALVVSRVLESMLWGIAPRDAATYIAVAVLVFVIAIAANLGPALRAGRVNPVTTLQ